MNNYFDGYEKKFPDIVIQILDYFSINNKKDSVKTISGFCEMYKQGDDYVYQPQIVSRICRRLCGQGVLCPISINGNLFGLEDRYLFCPNDVIDFMKDKDRLKFCCNSIVYGFEYIYDIYKDLVLYFVGKNDKGDFTVGTGFKYANGIVTAKHCIEDVISLQVKGYKAVDLTNKPVYISDNKALDIAFIETGEVASPYCLADDGEVLQEVLVMGYPKIPTFTDFLVAEKATISSKASARLTPTKGFISAFGNEYLSKLEAMLITAKITGGNSGGPVINQYGCIVGVACRKPSYDDSYGDYDDLGYGIAIPMKQVVDVINRKPKKYDIPDDFFQDFDAGD